MNSLAQILNNLGKGLKNTAIGAGLAAGQAGMGLEKGFRIFATKPMFGPLKDPLDAYFPWFNSVGHSTVQGGRNIGFKKYAMNPTIAKRLMMAGSVYALGSGAMEAVRGRPAPEPTVFFDGVSLRHMNDLGADSGYARNVLANQTGMAFNPYRM